MNVHRPVAAVHLQNIAPPAPDLHLLNKHEISDQGTVPPYPLVDTIIRIELNVLIVAERTRPNRLPVGRFGGPRRPFGHHHTLAALGSSGHSVHTLLRGESLGRNYRFAINPPYGAPIQTDPLPVSRGNVSRR